MANTKFTALKAQAHENLVKLFNERLTKLDDLRNDARELMAKFEYDPEANEPITPNVDTPHFVESYKPFYVAEVTEDNIRDLARQIEAVRNELERNIEGSRISEDIEIHNAYANNKLKTFDWEISILEKPLTAFEGGYEAGVAAYWQATREWKDYYGV